MVSEIAVNTEKQERQKKVIITPIMGEYISETTHYLFHKRAQANPYNFN